MPAVFVLVQVVLYVGMAPRGFEFTDESYYLLNYLHWRDVAATVSFFGAYFEGPFRLLGQSVTAMRILSLVMLFGASGFFSRTLLGFSRRDATGGDVPLVSFAIVGTAASFFYFGYFSSVRAPSYNLLALCAMLVATGLLLRLTTLCNSRRCFRLAAFGYGLAVAACGLSKAPTGVLMFALHATFFAIANRDWQRQRLVELLSLIVAGVVFTVGLLQWTDPSWLSALREGVAITNTSGHGGLFDLAGTAAQEASALAPAVAELGAFAVLIIACGRFIRHNRQAQLSIAVVAVTGACALELARSQDRHLWLPTVALCVLILWSFETPWRGPSKWTRSDAINVGTTWMLLGLPLVFSFGTNLRLSEHSEMAAVFGIAALLLRLQRLAEQGRVTIFALGASLALLALPTLVIQFQNTFDPGHAYRLRTALIDQTIPARVGPANARVLLDTATRNVLVAIRSAGDAAGFAPGQPVFDLTGDGPGLIYALRGRPLGSAWITGGYSASEHAAARLISDLPIDELRTAWLLTSRTNPRRIVGWQRLLAERLGAGTHELVATVRMRSPYVWHASVPEAADVDLWRPLRGLSR